jgi:hypothetical protein
MTPKTIIIDSENKRDRAVKWLSRVPVDEVMELSLRPYKSTRSQKQNARYFLILDKIAEETGHDKYEVHEACKALFLGTQETAMAGKKVQHGRSSARLNVKEFAQYAEKVEAWAIEHLGIWLE